MSDTYHLIMVGACYIGLATAIGIASGGHSVDVVNAAAPVS
jgi:2-polyprenyl-6-methoxyphenol hydroxylase-like FAD-dependent oxidoreductase